MDFHGFPSMSAYNGKIGPAAPIEAFARFQLPAIIDSLMLAAGWLAAGWLAMIGCYLVEWKIETTALQHARRSGEVGGFH